MSSKEVVRQILDREGIAMEWKEIVRRAEKRGLRATQVSGALHHLRRDGTVESVERGTWRIVEQGQPHTPDEPPNVGGLTGKEAVFQILAHVKKPMKKRDIGDWLEANGQEPLTDGQIDGGFYDLLHYYLNVVEKVEPGTYRIHKNWNGEPLEKQARIDSRPEPQRPPNLGPSRRAEFVIPCFGLHWERSLVSWSGGRNLLGTADKDGDDGDAVNFANQSGVYVLYQWPQVTYVGRTTSDLFGRLKTHDAEIRKGLWDKLSWFGLCEVDDDGRLRERGQLGIADEVMMMEALLISALRPPLNLKGGDGMGVEYLQVPDPVVEEREEKALANRLNQLMQRVYPQR